MNCLLCLKINEIGEDYIKFNSEEWQALNIQYIIEKYLWKMENLNDHSNVCQPCWQELNNFHKFYIKIERAHSNLTILIKPELISEDALAEKANQTSASDTKESSQLKPEILLLKEENPLDIFEKEDVEISCIRKRAKRKCSLKRDIQNIDKNTLRNKSKKRCKKEKKCGRLNSPKADISHEEKDTQLDDEHNDKVEEENDCKKFTSDENFSDHHDGGFESEDEPSNNLDSPKLHQLRQEHDRYIAEHMQIICAICQTPLSTFSTTIKHYKEEHNQRGYAICCNRKLYDRSEIMDHIKLHQNPEFFKCNYCEKILSSRICLKLHIKNVHEHKNVACDICGKSLATESSLKMHKLLHDADNNEKIPCKQCDKSYLSKFSLANHIRSVHLKKYHKICDLCGESISGKSRFKRHMLEHEGKAPPMVSCSVCGRRLADLKCLKRHMGSHHPPEGIKPEFNCPMCTKVFASPSNVKMHIKVVHENSYERKCTLCEKTFKRPDALKDHMAKHIGKPLHACGFCPKTFYSNGQMHAHRKRVHPLEWQESVREKFSGNLPEKYVTKTTDNNN